MTWQAPETIPHRPRTPVLALLTTLTGVELGLAGAPEPGLCLVLGLALVVAGSVAGWLGSRVVPLRLREEGLDPGPAGPVVRFDEIQALHLPGWAVVKAESSESAAPLVIGHARGVWRVPRRPGLDRLGLYRWLLERTRLRAAPPSLPGRLDEVRAREVADFGPDRVLSSVGRATSPGELPRTRWVACLALATALTALLVPLTGIDWRYGALLGGMAGFLGLMALLVAGSESRRRARVVAGRTGAGIVVSPRGLTLESGPLRGELRWAEVRRLSLANSRSPLACGLRLHLEGTTLLIRDDFSLPLGEIEPVVRQHLAHG